MIDVYRPASWALFRLAFYCSPNAFPVFGPSLPLVPLPPPVDPPRAPAPLLSYPC